MHAPKTPDLPAHPTAAASKQQTDCFAQDDFSSKSLCYLNKSYFTW